MTAKLLGFATSNWPDLDGWATARGIELLDLPLARFEHLVWFYLIRNVESDHEQIEKVRIQLWRPPRGVVADRGPWSAEAETAAFGALKAQVT